MIYSGYRSYETEESLYQTIIAANTPEETESEQDETETVIVDAFFSSGWNIRQVWQLMFFKKVIAIKSFTNVVLLAGWKSMLMNTDIS